MEKETIEFMGIELEIGYTYQPEEGETWGHRGGHPHIPEEYEICTATLNGVDVYPLIEDYTEEIEKALIKKDNDMEEASHE